MWVPLIENNEHETEAGREFIRNDIKSLMNQDKNIDTIVLGCTHYPVLQEYIQSIVPDHVKVIAQGKIVAASLHDYLRRHPWLDAKCSRNGTLHFLTSENTAEFNANAEKFIGETVSS